MKLTENPEFHYHTKHINKAFHFQRQFVLNSDVSFRYIQTDRMIADALTKALPTPAFRRCVVQMGLKEVV